MTPFILCVAVYITMPVGACRKRPAAARPLPPDDGGTFRALAQCGNKTNLGAALTALQSAGWLTAAVRDHVGNTRRVKASMATAVTAHTDATTPYGRVIQTMGLPLHQYPQWNYCHPMAYVHYLSTISSIFSELMCSSIVDGSVGHIILYVDEICPGNPFRPERSRTLQAIYWAFSEWPQHVLQRTAAWLTFGTIRATLADALDGGLAQLMNIVIKTCFPHEGHSFRRGVLVVRNAAQVLVRSVFSGFLADEKALKLIHDYKGASGTKCCMDCKFVFNRVDKDTPLPAGAYNLTLTDLSRTPKHTKESIYAMVDSVLGEADDTERDRKEQLFGLKANPHGLLADPYTRTFYDPSTMYLRDWMHTMVSGGVANVLCAELVKCFQRQRVKLGTIVAYFSHFVPPHRHGKLHAAWLNRNRFGKQFTSLGSFSGQMLTIVPILNAFCEDYATPRGLIPDMCRLFWLLNQILLILSLGSDGAVPHIPLLRRTVEEFADLFVASVPFSQVKPKFHHLLHIPDQMAFLNKCLSCFVCERKHRSTKRAAVYVFRHIDNTVLKDLVNRQCETFRDGSGASILQARFLAPPIRQLEVHGVALKFSKGSVLPCGLVRRGDLVYLVDNVVGRVVNFWQGCVEGSPILTEVTVYPRDPASPYKVLYGSDVRFVDTADIVDAVIWAVGTVGQSIRFIPPFLP